MQSKAIRKAKRAIRRIKRINKENVRMLDWLKGKIKLLGEELASKKQCIPVYNKLIADGESKLRVLKQRVTVLEQRARTTKNGKSRKSLRNSC